MAALATALATVEVHFVRVCPSKVAFVDMLVMSVVIGQEMGILSCRCAWETWLNLKGHA